MPDSKTTIAQIKENVRVFCKDREWDKYDDGKDLAIGIVTEASELLEHFRFKSEAEVQAMMNDVKKRTIISDEIADVMFFLVRLSQKYAFDITDALSSKMEANAARYPVDVARGSNKKYAEFE
jgi:NTP pyrophosphatase (non-canonical NTP hydrolase)